MKTKINNIEQVTETGLLKALALKQFNNEDFFILGEKAYDGTEENAREEFKESMKDEPIGENENESEEFEIWCEDNLTEIEPIEDDEERDDHIVLTDEEADEKAAEYIKDSLWAFNPSFLSNQTGLDEEIFQAIADNGKCESNNDTIYNTIERLGDMEEFISDAISADGRGHFMSSYDGNENEETVNGETFYIYRIN